METNIQEESGGNAEPKTEAVEDLPLADRIKLAESHKPFQGIKEGWLIDAKDTVDNWCVANVLKATDTDIRINYDGWSEKYDDNMKLRSHKIAEFRQASRGYTGQMRVPLRTLKFTPELLSSNRAKLQLVVATDFGCLANAFEVTQYLRGHLFVFLDLLMTSEHKEENLPDVYSFLHLVVEAIVQWLKALKGDLLKSFIEYKKCPKLSLVDRKCALAACGYELLDMLKWLFGLCPRTGVIFGKYDTEVEPGSGKFTRTFEDKNFVANRNPEFAFDLFRDKLHYGQPIVYGLLINLFEKFCSCGGLDATMEVISLEGMSGKAEALGFPGYKLPFEVVAMALHPLKGAKFVASEEVCKRIALAGKEAFVKWIDQLDEKEIKDLNKDLLNSELELIKDFLTLGYSEHEAMSIMQSHEMMISLKFLQSGSLEKRLNAISDIKKMIDQVEMRAGHGDEFLMKWLLQHNILGKVLDENTHSEIIKRSSVIFEFLAKRNAITTDILEMLWKCQQEKHEDIVLAIYNAIKNIVEFLTPQQIQFIYEKIKNFSLDHYDEKLIGFMKNFTASAFSSIFTGALDSETVLEVPKPVSDSDGVLAVPEDPRLYFVMTFWELVQDESAASAQQANAMLKCLRELLSNPFCEVFRAQYLYLCIENLKRHRSVPQSLELAVYILEMSALRSNINLAKPKEWAKELWQKHNLFALFMEDCENYERLVREFCEKAGTQDNIEDSAIAGKYRHKHNIERRFYFFEQTMRIGGKDADLGRENIERLCSLYIDNICRYDAKQFLISFSSKDETRAPVFIFNRKETKIFFDIISAARPKLISFGLAYYRCFANNFQLINMAASALKYIIDGILVLDFDELLGMDQLWDSVCHCEEKGTLKLFIDLLIAVHTKLDQGLSPEEKAKIEKAFIDRCFSTIMKLDVAQEELAITNLMKLLEAMFDYVDGKEFEMQLEPGQKLTLTLAFKPGNETRNLEVGMDIKVGNIRKVASEIFHAPFSELKMQSKFKLFTQNDNESELRSLGWSSNFYFQRVVNNLGDVKTFLAENQTYINALFALLAKENTGYVDLVWKLLNNVPANKEMQTDIKFIRLAEGQEWDALLDSKSIYKFLYGLQIIEGILGAEQTQEEQRWIKEFCKTGGLTHLFNSLMSLSTGSLHNPLSRRCFALLIKIVHTMQSSGFTLKEWVKEYSSAKANMIDTILIVLSAFSRYSIPEAVDGDSKEANEGKGGRAADNAAQTQDKRELILEGKAFQYGFSLIRNEESNYFECIARFADFKGLLLNGLVLSGNPFIKAALKDEIMRIFDFYRDKQLDTRAHAVLVPYMLQTMVRETLHANSNCECFYELLCLTIKSLPKEGVELAIDFGKETRTVAGYIREHKVRENKATDKDYLLIGLMNVLYELIAKFPDSRDEVGKEMLDEVLHKCLFEFPDSESRIQLASSIPPKCKSEASRKAALNLLFMLCRDSPSTISKVLEYLMPIHTKASWRTSRRSDWVIVAESDEKSTTGYVGLKNLGAICYMNSLLQQFYMIPSFRSDILGAVDPEATTENSMLFQTQCLFSALSKSVKQYYNPKAFCHAVKDWDNNPINVLEQMDVDEFFNLFLDRLETALKRTHYKDTIKRHFGGVFANQIIGKDCPHTSTRKEPFLALNLQVKNKRSLQQCLESFVNGEMLQGNNAYFCEKCDKKITALKRTCIKRLPKHLICVLKRFDINYDTMQKFKINDYCEFPRRINMEPFTEEGLAKLDKEKEIEKARREGRDIDMGAFKDKPLHPKEYYEYKLTGVVIHIGTSDMGHYYSLIMDREHGDEEQWYEFNDTQVEKYELERMRDDAFGNEGKMSYFVKMRNAYLLFYDRASPYEPPEEDDEEAVAEKPHKLPSPVVDVTKELHREIQEENRKYWYNRYIFQNDYFGFVVKLGVAWNSNEIVTSKYPTKNQDYHLLGIEPEEGHLVNSIKMEAIGGEPLREPLSAEEQQRTSLHVAKYVVTVLLTTLLRFKLKNALPNLVDVCKAYLNKHLEASQWLVLQFTNSKIVNEFLLECPEKRMAKFAAGLVYCAMLNVYNSDKAAIAAYDPGKSLILNFANGLLNQLPTTQKSGIFADQFFQLLSRVAFLGPEIRSALLRQDTLKSLLNLLYSDIKSIYDSKVKDEDGPKWSENENVELGLPTVLNTKFSNFFKDYYAIYRERDTESSNTFLIEAITLLLRTTGFDGKTKDSPFALPGDQVEASEEVKAAMADPKQIHELFTNCKCNLAFISLTKALAHISWRNPKMKITIVEGIDLSQIDADNADIYIYLMKELLKCEDSLEKTTIDSIMIECLKEMKQVSMHYQVLPFAKLLTALVEDVPLVADWFKENVDKWNWIVTWLNDSSIVKPKRNFMISFDRGNDEQTLLEENAGQFAHFFELLSKAQQPPRILSVDDIATMYYKKFAVGEEVEHVSIKTRVWGRWVVRTVLDEMVLLRTQGEEAVVDWAETEKDDVARVGSYTKDKDESKEEAEFGESKEEFESDEKDERDDSMTKEHSNDSINKDLSNDK